MSKHDSESICICDACLEENHQALAARRDGIACVEVWYNRSTRDWVVQHHDSAGVSRGSDYCGDRAWAISVAEGYGVPIFFTTPHGERKEMK